TYQIKQAKFYIREHLTQSPLVGNDMEFIIELCAQHNDLVRARFESITVTTKITSLPYNSSSIRSHQFLAGIVLVHQGGVIWNAALTWQLC
ncbi:unnamed protein product, partial [Rotaria socialis]